VSELRVARTPAGGRIFEPYLPLVVLEWLNRTPEAAWRELEGTLAFVDISGFTAMSERLAARGKAGAEEVTETMNATFAPLLAVAYEYGGGLLKFGGDALLLFFDGPDHALRAARAAWRTRATLAALGPVRTTAGRVRLQMHAGLFSGPCHFFLVGDRHRELIVAGPAATATVAAESAAAAGEIVVAGEPLPDDVLGEPRGGGRLLVAEPAAATLPNVGPVPFLDELDLAACVPVALRPHLSTDSADAEHRRAAVAFVRFTGVDDAIAADGNDPAAAAVHELVVAVQAAAAEHDVCFLESDLDANGARIVLVAGAPETAGNDEERLLRAARAVVEAGTALRPAVGVHRGHVFAGKIGPPFRRTYTILGETAALAARLMARAEPGQVLATTAVTERSRTIFSGRPLEPFRVKGRSEPVDAIEVGPVAGLRAAEPERLPMVDRKRELAILEAALSTVRLGYGTLVELVGEPGIGKSRLVEELRARAADMTLVAAACDQYEAMTPYYAFRSLLRELIGSGLGDDAEENSRILCERLAGVAPELEPWIPLLALTLDVPALATREVDELGPEFQRARLHGVVSTLLSKLLGEPTIVLFEDTHWMDDASVELLRHLGEHVASQPWLACATRRPVPGESTGSAPTLPAMTIRLDPLPEEDAQALAAAAAGDGLRADELAPITERAGGNPLFVRELVAAARSDAAAGAEQELPQNVESLVAARIDRLPPHERTLLRWASVIGHAFAGEILESVLGGPDAVDPGVWDRLAEFVERDPFVPGSFRFRHQLIRDAAYEGLPYRRRRELHLRVAEAYERLAGGRPEEVAELLSLHFHRAQDDAKTWTHSLAAAERARSKGANVEAVEFYGRALDAAKCLRSLDPRELGRVWEARGDACELAGRYDDAAESYRSARRALEPAGPQPGLLLKEGTIRERAARYGEAIRWYRRGLAALEQLPAEERPLHRAELRLASAGVRYRQGDSAECVALSLQAVEDAQAAGDLGALAHAYYLLHLAYTSLGSPDRQHYRDLALPIFEELGDLVGQANALNNLGIDAYYEGRWAEALGFYERSREARRRVGDVVGEAMLANNIGEIRSDQGLHEEAGALFTEAEKICREAGSAMLTAVAQANLGRLAARRGDAPEARRLLESALDGFTKIRATAFIAETRTRLAEAALLEGRTRAAVSAAEAALPGAPPVLAARLHRVRGCALLALGDPDEGAAALERSLAIARAGDLPFEAALTLKALSGTGSDPGTAAEADALLAALGVVATPDLAIP
jgi:class 3 adenylate cyclase/tetratricopeptide (TPR) repeat protein